MSRLFLSRNIETQRTRVAIASMAGASKEVEMAPSQKQATIVEFNFRKGLGVATFCGVMSACFAFGLAAAAPIGDTSTDQGTNPILAGLPKLPVVLAGGWLTNAIWCGVLAKQHGSAYEFFSSQARQPPPQETQQQPQPQPSARTAGVGVVANPVHTKCDRIAPETGEAQTARVPEIEAEDTWESSAVVWLRNRREERAVQAAGSLATALDDSALGAGGAHPDDLPCINTAERTERESPSVVAARQGIPLLHNYCWCTLAGVTWYCQFFFYTMGESQMGRYGFASWTLHMSSIIIFSTVWGVALKEWTGASGKTLRLLAIGLGTLILATLVIGLGAWSSSNN
jgi:hypothetical protein